MLMWIFFWWLLGAVVIYAATWREWSIQDLEFVTLRDLLATLVGGLIWPFVLGFIAIQDDWLDLPIFDLDWFRKEKDDE